MNKIFVAGFFISLASFAGGWFVGRHHRGKWFEEQLDKAIRNEHRWYEKRVRELDENYIRKLNEAGIVIRDEEKEAENEKSENSPEEKSEKVDDIPKIKRKRKTEYDKFQYPDSEEARMIFKRDLARMDEDMRLAREHPEEDDEDEEEIKRPPRKLQPGEWREPYLIDEDDFHDPDETRFEKIDVFYWEGCGTFSEADNDQPIDDPHAIFGDEAMCEIINLAEGIATETIEVSEENKYIYVRNEGLGIDYCLEPKMGTYARNVLGILD